MMESKPSAWRIGSLWLKPGRSGRRPQSEQLYRPELLGPCGGLDGNIYVPGGFNADGLANISRHREIRGGYAPGRAKSRRSGGSAGITSPGRPGQISVGGRVRIGSAVL